jgi:hypothetical protein
MGIMGIIGFSWSLLFIVAVVVSYILLIGMDGRHSHDEGLVEEEAAEAGKLLPIMSPAFNMRECAKQIILLEDHLFNPKKRCHDCIKKHFMTIEGLAEEAITLDKTGEVVDDANGLVLIVRKCEKEFIHRKNYDELGQTLRQCRKPLMYKYFGSF